MGLGFNYLNHTETAKHYLRTTIKFIKKYPNFIIRNNFLEKDSYLIHGRYFIVKNSQVPPEKILEHCKILEEEYTRLCP